VAKKAESSDEESSEEVPAKKAPAKKVVAKKAESSSEEESSEEVPVKKAPVRKVSSKKSSKKVSMEIETVKKVSAPVDPNAEWECRVSGLSYDAYEADIESFFNTFASVLSVKLLTDRDTGRSKGMAFVKFTNEAEMNKAIDNTRCEMMGRYLNVA
jgi:RNA recognition motif-containing protein